MNKKTIINASLTIAIALCCAILIFAFQSKTAQTDNNNESAANNTLNIAGIGGAFSLMDTKGETVTDENLKGQYSLLFFGFTYCPAICPTELQKITEAYVALPKATQDKLKLYFITLDPERDTKEILKNYVGLFHPNLTGLYGSVEQIETIKKAFKVYGAKVPQGDSYTIDHSSFIYLMGKDGELLRIFKGSDKADFIKDELEKIIL